MVSSLLMKRHTQDSKELAGERNFPLDSKTCSGRPERDNGPLEWGMGGLGSCELGLLGTSRSESKECPGKGLGQAACDSTQAEAGEGKVSA